jgi:hypothetical protein
MKNPLVFGGGIPTEPDVKRLRDEVGTPVVGVLVEYKIIEEALGNKKGSHRFASVVGAWRKELYREHNLLMVAIPNKGLQAATTSRRTHVAGSKAKNCLRGICRAGDIAAKTESEGLSLDEIRARDHVVKLSAALRLTAATAAKQLKYPDPVKNGK